MNDFKSSSSEENVTKSCIFESNYSFFGDSSPVLKNPVEYIEKRIISVLTVPLDERNYAVSLPSAGALQEGFFKNSLNSQKCRCCK